jgi:hypothetical protein
MKHASIDGRGQQIICSSDCVDITCEVQVEFFAANIQQLIMHGHYKIHVTSEKRVYDHPYPPSECTAHSHRLLPLL